MATTIERATPQQIDRFTQTYLSDSPFCQSLIRIFDNITSVAQRIYTQTDESGQSFLFAGASSRKTANSVTKLRIERYNYQGPPPVTHALLSVSHYKPDSGKDFDEETIGPNILFPNDKYGDLVARARDGIYGGIRAGDVQVLSNPKFPVMADDYHRWLFEIVAPSFLRETASLDPNTRLYGLALT